MVTRIAFEQAMRAAAVDLLTDYADNASLRLQVYPARPMSLYPPTAFVDRLGESIAFVGPTLRQRTVRAEVLVVHGLFDSAEATVQRDAFADGFADYVTDNYHAAGAQTLIASVGIDDDPVWVPDWGSEQQRNQTYYATRITLEGFAEG